MKDKRAAEYLIVGLLLACAGGYVDAYTYLTRGGVFCYAQTANLLVLSISVLRGGEVWRYLATFAAFAAGLFAARGIAHLSEKHRTEGFRIGAVVLMIAILFTAGALPATIPDLYVTSAVAFASALQYSSFRTIRGNACSTTMCTANLRSAIDAFYDAVVRRSPGAWSRAGQYLAVIAVFFGAVMLSKLGADAFGTRSVWFAAIPLAAAAVILGVGARTGATVIEQTGEESV